MTPETVLGVKFPYDDDEVRAKQKEWLAVYRELALAYPAVRERAEHLAARVDAAYASYTGKEKREETFFDGDFPLGNERDMGFAIRYFSLGELARIELGLSFTIDLEATAQNVPADRVRRAFLAETEGRWADAVREYASLSKVSGGNVAERERACIEKARRARGCCPRCGSTRVTALDGVGRGGNITLDIAPDVWLCRDCGETFRPKEQYLLVMHWRYRCEKEGGYQEENEGEERYLIEQGASYPLPYFSEYSLEILSVGEDRATLRAAGETLTASVGEAPATRYLAKSGSVFGDTVERWLSLSFALWKEE